MAREFEVKLEIPASTVSKVMRLPWLWELASGEIQASHMDSVYYDTPRRALRARGITLRVRRIGAARLQTIKAAANGAALPIERSEWEEEIAGEEPELRLAAGTPLEALSKKKRRKLQPCFEAQVDRSAFPIHSANSTIEVAIDRAKLVSGDVSISFCEVELELKRGASSELARIARRIASEVPVSLSLKSKSDRGFALREDERPRARYAEPIVLNASGRVGKSFQSIGWACLQHFASNADAVKNADTKGVQQMRAGLLRLRTSIALFKRLLDGPETDAIEAELTWLIEELDPARDLDVFLEETLLPLREAQHDKAALDTLCLDAVARRHAALDRAKVAVSSDRYRQLVLRTALWIIAAEWSDKSEDAHEHPARRVAPFAGQVLAQGTQRIVAKLSRYERLDGRGRERLRAAVEQLRYAMEFFASLFPRQARRHADFQDALESVQKHLGRLNDIAVNERLRDGFMKTWVAEQATTDPLAAQKAFAMGFVLGQQQLEKALCGAAVEEEREQLAFSVPAWR